MLAQGSTLFTLLVVSPQGSGGGAIVGGAPPPQGSELVGDVGEATPHGSVAAAAVAVLPHGPEAAGGGTVGGGEGPADPTVEVAAGAPQGSTALSSIRALCERMGQKLMFSRLHSGGTVCSATYEVRYHFLYEAKKQKGTKTCR